MRNLFFTAAFLATSVIAINATENTDSKPVNDNIKTVKITTNDDESTVNIFHWYVKTESGVYTGAAETLKEVKDRIEAISTEGNIVKKRIRFVALDNDTEKIYTWGVANDKGNASGITRSLADAKKMISLMNEGDVSHAKIIESFKVVK